MSFKKTHVVISDKRSHIFIVIVLLHWLFCPECVWWNLVCNQIRNRRFSNSNKFGLRLTDNKLKMRYIKLVLWKNIDDLLSKSSETLQKFSKDVLKHFCVIIYLKFFIYWNQILAALRMTFLAVISARAS